MFLQAADGREQAEERELPGPVLKLAPVGPSGADFHDGVAEATRRCDAERAAVAEDHPQEFVAEMDESAMPNNYRSMGDCSVVGFTCPPSGPWGECAEMSIWHFQIGAQRNGWHRDGIYVPGRRSATCGNARGGTMT